MQCKTLHFLQGFSLTSMDAIAQMIELRLQAIGEPLEDVQRFCGILERLDDVELYLSLCSDDELKNHCRITSQMHGESNNQHTLVCFFESDENELMISFVGSEAADRCGIIHKISKVLASQHLSMGNWTAFSSKTGGHPIIRRICVKLDSLIKKFGSVESFEKLFLDELRSSLADIGLSVEEALV